jgi:hypothetical protein
MPWCRSSPHHHGKICTTSHAQSPHGEPCPQLVPPQAKIRLSEMGTAGLSTVPFGGGGRSKVPLRIEVDTQSHPSGTFPSTPSAGSEGSSRGRLGCLALPTARCWPVVAGAHRVLRPIAVQLPAPSHCRGEARWPDLLVERPCHLLCTAAPQWRRFASDLQVDSQGESTVVGYSGAALHHPMNDGSPSCFASTLVGHDAQVTGSTSFPDTGC